MADLTVVFNRGAGGADSKRGDEIEAAFKASGLDFELEESGDQRKAKDIVKAALDRGVRHFCACGGDGTVAQVVEAMMKDGREGLELSIVPSGTANMIANALGIPSDAKEAVKGIPEGQNRPNDGGRGADSYFVLGIGIGATERFVTQANDTAKKMLGRLAYVASLWRETSGEPFEMSIEANGKIHPNRRVEAITLASFWGTPKVQAIRDAKPDDGTMEAVANERLSKGALFRLAWSSLFGRVHLEDDVEIYRGSKFRIETNPSLPIQLDGNESDLQTPCDVEVMRQALSVHVPAG